MWRDVPPCVGISSTKCNVTLAEAVDEHGCMRLRVRAKRRGQKSEAVQACSQRGEEPEPGGCVFALSHQSTLGSLSGDQSCNYLSRSFRQLMHP